MPAARGAAAGATACATGRTSRPAGWPTVAVTALSAVLVVAAWVVRWRTPSSDAWDLVVPGVCLAGAVAGLVDAARARPRLPRSPWGEAVAEAGVMPVLGLLLLAAALEAAAVAPVVSNVMVVVACVLAFALLGRAVVRYRRYGRLD